jgi:energy-coupling factor transport system permease protein
LDNLPLQRLDPRIKLTAAAILIVGLLVVDSALSLVIFASLIISAALLARFPIRLVAMASLALWPLLLLTMLIHGFASPSSGRVLLTLWSLNLTTTGLARGAIFAARLICFVFISRLVLHIGTGEEYARALGRIFSPFRRFRLPVGEMELVIGIAFRLIPILEREIGRLLLARRARGLAVSWIGKLRQLHAILIPLFVGAFRRADALAVAMEARGFVVGAPRSAFKIAYFKPLDGVVLLVVIGTTIAAIALS